MARIFLQQSVSLLVLPSLLLRLSLLSSVPVCRRRDGKAGEDETNLHAGRSFLRIPFRLRRKEKKRKGSRGTESRWFLFFLFVGIELGGIMAVVQNLAKGERIGVECVYFFRC